MQRCNKFDTSAKGFTSSKFGAQAHSNKTRSKSPIVCGRMDSKQHLGIYISFQVSASHSSKILFWSCHPLPCNLQP
ncbi:hypothetical protein CY35_13G106800 [Sphagnum magellanicum]|nr:hypothetical protein CY35_13G106800 [Sphagnum magellanicum]